MKRFIDFLAGTLSGILIGVAMCAAIVPDAWSVAPTPRPPQHADSGSLTPEMTPDGVSPVPSPSVAAGTGLPDPQPAPANGSSPSPIGTRPAVTAKPRTATPPRPTRSVRGLATWYCGSVCTAGYPGGLYAAAGSELRVGNWRGRGVTVSAGGRSVRVTLIDTCACPGPRVIDLYRTAFSRLAVPSRGVIRVTVRW